MESQKGSTLPQNPFGTASPISKTLFLWLFPLFRKGFKKKLEQEDLYKVCEEDESGNLGDKLEEYWNLEVKRGKLAGRKPRLLRALLKISWRIFGLATALTFLNQLVFRVAQPVFLCLLIQNFTGEEEERWKRYWYAGAICLTALLNTFITQLAFYMILYQSMKMRVATSFLIYRKILRLGHTAQRKTNTGQIVNLLSNDCSRFDGAFIFLPFPFLAPVQLVILSYLLYGQIGPASLAGVAFVLTLLPMLYYLGKYTATFRLQIAKRTDERGRFMNEIIGGMRLIKQYGWEKAFSNLIGGIRKEEMGKIRKKGLLRGVHNAIYKFSQTLVPFLTLVIFVMADGSKPMTADKVFFTLTCLHLMIQVTVQWAPNAITGLAEFTVAVQRIQEFLLLEEQITNNNVPPTYTLLKEKMISGDYISLPDIQRSNIKAPMETGVFIANACASWTNEGKPTLERITFSVEGDKLVMVVGPVGSSKTSLLQTITDQLPLSCGNLSVDGNVSYASQEPWIFGGNLRQNILFGLPFEEGHYKETLMACALEEDLKQLPYGDMTVVGERGVALSGGQKARVNLARALYKRSDIYLLDDPLSAVDTRVSRHLFEKGIKEHLRGTLRILVTHQLQYLPQADLIIVLDQGRILAKGTFEELTNANFDFKGLLATDNNNDKEEVGSSMDDKEMVAHQYRKPEENKETNVEGSVTARTYRNYFTAGHSGFTFATLLLVFIISQLLTSATDFWLAIWTNTEAKCTYVYKESMTALQPITYHDDKPCKDAYLGENNYVYIYTGLVLGVVLFNILRCLWFYLHCAKISVNLHHRMFHSVIRPPVKFFDDNQSGRILNRFTRDVGIIDEVLPEVAFDTLTIFLHIFGVICLVILSNYYMAIPTIFFFVVAYLMRSVFMATARDIKRIESTARSPVFSHVAATIQGLATIRAYKSENIVIKQFGQRQDNHSSSWFLFISANRCFGVWLELISNLFLVLVVFSFLFVSNSAEGGTVGLAIFSMLTLMGIIQWGMFQSAEMENHMISVERALEYSKLTPEAKLESNPDSKPPQDWPTLGQIEFKNVTLSYEEGKSVLKDLSFKIRPSEKIGIVGRTGAGKSSIIAALFRLTEPEGEILIDNVPVKQIGLHDIRKCISIIPQDPVLFSGSVRYNLDPFDNYKDDHLWRVIEEVELKDAVPSLDYRVADGGANFSVGQRQLMCLARAILRKNKILVMDEATANIDLKTDQLIQETIRSKFSNCTIITIAHRLDTVIDCDRIFVMDNGHLERCDHPHVLLQEKDGIFSVMVAQTGESKSAMLKKMASDWFRSKAKSKQANNSTN